VSLRALIEKKQRRTATLPLLVGDLVTATREVDTLRAALAVQQEERGAKTRATKAEEQTRKALQEALGRAAACVASVELQALPPDEWDELFGDLEPDDNGDLDLTSIHALALAASCTDPELQDAEWWAVQLKQPQWSKGDRMQITRILLDLNMSAPVGAPGKD
jgi:hypothetical protein